MKELLQQSSYFGFSITIIIYYLSVILKNKIKITIFHPLLITSLTIVILLLTFDIDYEIYNNSAKYISYFLTPTTVCLAVPLYKQIKLLKKNITAIICGITSGIIANTATIIILTIVFNIKNELGTSLLSKSVTAPIAIGLTEELGGITSITVFAVILSGIIGAVIAPSIFKILNIKNEIAQGLACGTAAHGSGTATALELGKIQDAMSGLAIIITGLITTMIIPLVNIIFIT